MSLLRVNSMLNLVWKLHSHCKLFLFTVVCPWMLLVLIFQDISLILVVTEVKLSCIASIGPRNYSTNPNIYMCRFTVSYLICLQLIKSQFKCFLSCCSWCWHWNSIENLSLCHLLCYVNDQKVVSRLVSQVQGMVRRLLGLIRGVGRSLD